MYDGASVYRGSKSADDVLLLAFGACGVRPEGREGWILRMGTARPLDDRVVRACDGAAVPPVAAATVRADAGWRRGSRYPRCVRSLPGHVCAPGPSHGFPTHGSPIPRRDAAGVAPRMMLHFPGLGWPPCRAPSRATRRAPASRPVAVGWRGCGTPGRNCSRAIPDTAPGTPPPAERPCPRRPPCHCKCQPRMNGC